MELVILSCLIVMNGVFAMSEMAVVSSRKARLQQLADDARPGASAALGLANEPSNFLSTIQVGITLIGITSGAFGEAALSAGVSQWLSQWPWLATHAHVLSTALVVGGITLASLIVGELVPKRLALLNPEAIASLIARPMQLLSKLAYPVVRALSLTTDAVLKLLRVGGFKQPPVTEEEIKVLMAQGEEAGIFEQHERKLVARVFRFDHVRVGGIMTPRSQMVCLDPDEPWEINARRIVEHGHSRFPVVKGGPDRLEGIVFARDLLADALAGRPMDLGRHMAKALFVPTRLSAMELVELFRKHRQTAAVAIDEHGAVDGFVTVNDVMEALVGDIATAEEEDAHDLVLRSDGSWLIDGSVTIERLKSTLEIDDPLPGEEADAYHTVAGFMMEQLGRLPATGDAFDCLGWRWEVVDMDERRVDKVLVAPLPYPAATGG